MPDTLLDDTRPGLSALCLMLGGRSSDSVHDLREFEAFSRDAERTEGACFG